MTEEEKEAVMKDDFHVDSGGDGSVDREEFRFSIFQLADQWTCSVNADEYIAFLKRGYDIVFDDLIKADKINLPDCWNAELKKIKNLTPMPVLRCVDIMTNILSSKFVSDDIARSKKKDFLPLGDFVIDFFRTKHGTGQQLKQFKGFQLALSTLLEDESNPVYHFALLFAQMCGFHTKSGRLVAFSHEATLFLLQHMEGVLVIARATSKKGIIPSSIGLMEYQGDAEEGAGGVRRGSAVRRGSNGSVDGGSTVRRCSVGKIGIDGRSNVLISGVLELSECSKYLSKVLKTELNMDEKQPLHKVALLSLAALSSQIDLNNDKFGGDNGVSGVTSISVVQSMRFSVLLSIVYSAWNNTIRGHFDEKGFKEHVNKVQNALFTRANVGHSFDTLDN
mmetsp:Transcript_17633/g.22927  ORF Transcript_17633/g.22927 Transcript_17633/m.22927 type:complete len:392 (-) Transcript_17633:190-1365(-)